MMQQQPSTSNAPAANRQQNQPQSTIQFSRELPPTLLRIHADNQDKRNICIFWVVFFVVIVAITITSSFLPKQTFKLDNVEQLKGTNIEGCANPNGFDSNNMLICSNATNNGNRIGGLMMNLIRENQFAVVMWRITLVDKNVIMQSIDMTVNATFYYLKYIYNTQTPNLQKTQQQNTGNQTFSLQFPKSLQILSPDGGTLIGYSQPVSAIRNILQENRLVIIALDRNVTDIPNVSQIKAQVIIVNPQFTKYSIVIRYIFFAGSLVACVLYIIMYRKIPASQRIIQQKLILILSILLVMFNDPFYPITILLPNKASSYFSVFVVMNFVIFLIFFWIMFLDRMLYENGQKQTTLLNWKRILYIAITYIFVIVLYTLIAIDFNQGLPIIRAEEIVSTKYIGLELFTLLLLLIGFVYIAFTYVRLCVRADEMLWRNQLFLFFSVFFIIMTIALFFVNGFQINHLAGNRILLTFTMMNMYTFYMQYMYTISSQERQRARRGQIQHGGIGLLEVKSGDDCVDLEFDQESFQEKKFTNQKMEAFVNRNKGEIKEREEEPVYSPKYGDNYDEDLKGPTIINPKIKIQEDAQTDFFNQKRIEEEQDKQVQRIETKKLENKKEDKFQEFSLDD